MGGAGFIVATDLRPGDPAWPDAEGQAAALAAFAAGALGVPARVELAGLPTSADDDHFGQVIDRLAAGGCAELFVLPAVVGLSVWQKSRLGEELAGARRRHRGLSLHHDAVDPTHPLLVECFAGQVGRGVEALGVPPGRVGLVLAADGRGDRSTRADSYRLMRLLWEQAGLGRAEVGFVGRAEPALPSVLGRCAAEPLDWLVLPPGLWGGEPGDRAGAMLAAFRRANPAAAGWRLLDPPGDHPAVRGWLEQRLLGLWKEKRARQAGRAPSARREAPPPPPAGVWSGRDWVPAGQADIRPADGLIGRAREPAALAEILARVLPPSDRYLVKVTWHGYAPGTYTGPAALDLLLAALPGRAVILEGHTSGRNLGGADWDWEADAERHRTWVRQQDAEFLRRTGLAEVIARHKGQYLNVTEAWWDGATAPAGDVSAALGDVVLSRPELAGFVPAVLMEHRGTPLISFARFKGPTRLGLSNLFGLIPHPLRTAWHGTGVTDFAAVCRDLARLYGALFPTFGLVEAFDSAVRWDRKGLYRSRWGNYDLITTDGLFTLSEGLVGADLLASRLQGQDVGRSGFYDVVRGRLGWSPAAAAAPLPADIQAALA